VRQRRNFVAVGVRENARGVVELTELDTQWLMANLVVRNGSSFRLPSLAARVASPAPGEIAAAARLCAGVAPAS